jgi:DNA-binding NarL/FixJ family response regulator
MNTRVLLIDDHPMFRAGIRLLLQSLPAGIVVVGESSTGAAALDLVRELSPDLLLLDLHLPDLNGLEVARQLLAHCPGLKIILLTAESALPFINAALQAGVSAYLLKSSASEELPRALSAVLAGGLYVSPELTSLVLQGYKETLSAIGAAPKAVLSDQERHVLRLLAQGRRMKEIAAELGIGVRTVETYRQRLVKKVGCQNAADLVRYAIREGIVPP